MNFGELKAQIESLLGRTPSDLAYTLAQADIAKKLNILEMEAVSTFVGAASTALPSGFGGITSIYVDSSPRRDLSPLPLSAFNAAFLEAGDAHNYAISNGSILINPETTHDVVMTYSATPSLVNDSDENDILDNYPDVYVYGVLTHHAGLIKDLTAAQAWSVAYSTALSDANTNDQAKRLSGNPVVPQVRVAP